MFAVYFLNNQYRISNGFPPAGATVFFVSSSYPDAQNYFNLNCPKILSCRIEQNNGGVLPPFFTPNYLIVNTLGVPIAGAVFARASAGNYTMTLTGAFKVAKTHLFISPFVSDAILIADVIDNDSLLLRSQDPTTQNLKDQFFAELLVHVYP